MNRDQQYQQRWWQRALIVAVLLTCLRVWIGPLGWEPQAMAQIPDPGQQRIKILEEVRRTNALLAEIKGILTSHTFNVKDVGADNQAD